MARYCHPVIATSLANKPYPLISLKYLPSAVVILTPGQATRKPLEKQRLYANAQELSPLDISSQPVEYPVSNK